MADYDDDNHERQSKRKRADPEAQAEAQDAAEVSLSIEETNKLRISLGLKPLQVGPPAAPNAEQQARQAEVRRQLEKERQAEEIRRKIAESKERRRAEEFLAVKGLGAADDEDDDLASWVDKTRRTQQGGEQQQQQQEKAEGEGEKRKRRRRKAKDNEDDEDNEDEGGYSARELAGLKVRHGLGELEGGEAVVLTLADRSILDEQGDLDEEGADELENVLMAEDKARAKARKAATKTAKPLWEEDGKVRSLLDKYDEEEDMVLQLDERGMLDEQQRKQDDIRRKLAAGSALLDSAAPSVAASRDFMTSEEAEKAGGAGGFAKRKKKQGKEGRKIRATKVATLDEEEEGGSTADVIKALEAHAEEAGGDGAGGAGDLGRRSDRAAAQARKAEAERSAQEEKRARFEAALQKANWASLALKQSSAAASSARGADLLDLDLPSLEEDDELARSLERARKLALAQSSSAAAPSGPPAESKLEGVAREAQRRREEEERKLQESLKQGGRAAGGEEFNDTTEFVRGIQVKQEEEAAGIRTVGGAASEPQQEPPAPPAKEASYMDIDEEEEEEGGKEGAQPPDEAAEAQAAAHAAAARIAGRWVSEEEAAAVASQTAKASRQGKKGGSGEGPGQQGQGQAQGAGGPIELQEPGITGERLVGRGLAAALGFLKDKGSLKTEVEWAGRANDVNAARDRVFQLGDVYKGGAHDDRIARSIERALTQKDALGRVMTPKERFRELCYKFHGKGPSKNKVEKKMQKIAQDVQLKQSATSANTSEVDKMLEVQKTLAQPFVVLQGKGALMLPPPAPGKKGGQSDKKRGSSSNRPSIGNLTPLLGDRKVEAMYGIKKPEGK